MNLYHIIILVLQHDVGNSCCPKECFIIMIIIWFLLSLDSEIFWSTHHKWLLINFNCDWCWEVGTVDDHCLQTSWKHSDWNRDEAHSVDSLWIIKRFIQIFEIFFSLKTKYMLSSFGTATSLFELSAGSLVIWLIPPKNKVAISSALPADVCCFLWLLCRKEK